MSRKGRRSSITSASTCFVIESLRLKIKDCEDGQSVIDDASPFKYGAIIQTEQILIDKKVRTVRVAYMIDHKYKIGWVVDWDLTSCMICSERFGWIAGRFKHHCRACGWLVCHKCSPYFAKIPGLEETKGSRVCKNCFGLKPGVVTPSNSAASSIQSLGSVSVSSRSVSPMPSIAPKDSGNKLNSSGGTVRRRTSRINNAIRSSSITEMEIYEAAQRPLYEEAYRRMREIIPLDIYKLNISHLANRGLPDCIAERLWNNKILWLICMHPDDIAKVHLADFRSKYIFNGLDILEMRAIWFILPKWDEFSENPLDRGKIEWKEGFKSKLDNLVYMETAGTLSDNQRRNIAYEGWDHLHLFDASAPLVTRFDRSASFTQHPQFSPMPEGPKGYPADPGSLGSISSNEDLDSQTPFGDVYGDRLSQGVVRGRADQYMKNCDRISEEYRHTEGDKYSKRQETKYRTLLEEINAEEANTSSHNLSRDMENLRMEMGGAHYTGFSHGDEEYEDPGDEEYEEYEEEEVEEVEDEQDLIGEDLQQYFYQDDQGSPRSPYAYNDSNMQESPIYSPLGVEESPKGLTPIQEYKQPWMQKRNSWKLSSSSPDVIPSTNVPFAQRNIDNGTAEVDRSGEFVFVEPSSPQKRGKITPEVSPTRVPGASISDDYSNNTTNSAGSTSITANGKFAHNTSTSISQKIEPPILEASSMKRTNSYTKKPFSSNSTPLASRERSSKALLQTPDFVAAGSAFAANPTPAESARSYKFLGKGRDYGVQLEDSPSVFLSRGNLTQYYTEQPDSPAESQMSLSNPGSSKILPPLVPTMEPLSPLEERVSGEYSNSRGVSDEWGNPIPAFRVSDGGGGKMSPQKNGHYDAGTLRVAFEKIEEESLSSKGKGKSLMKPPPKSPGQTPMALQQRVLAAISAMDAREAVKILQGPLEVMEISVDEVSMLLLQLTDPSALAQLTDEHDFLRLKDTLVLLLDELGATVNIVDSAGKSPLLCVVEQQQENPQSQGLIVIGKELFKRGADIFQLDKEENCPLSVSLLHKMSWLLEEFVDSGLEDKLLVSDSTELLLRYASYLILAGYSEQAGRVIQQGNIKITADKATEMMGLCQGNFDVMLDPVGTFELLESLGAALNI